MSAVRFSETSGSIYSVAQRYILEELNPYDVFA